MKEVAVARSPSVFVRELTPEEASKLRSLSRRSKYFAIRQRAQILLASATGVAAAQIATVLRTDENQVRRVIREFNADGMASLRPPTGGGRPRKVGDDTRQRVVDAALARPGDLGEPGTRWSLRRLRRYLVRAKVVTDLSLTPCAASWWALASPTSAPGPGRPPTTRSMSSSGLRAHPVSSGRGGDAERGGGVLRRVRAHLASALARGVLGPGQEDPPHPSHLPPPHGRALPVRLLRGGRRQALGISAGQEGRLGGAGLPEGHPPSPSHRHHGVHRHGQPLHALDPGHSDLGRRRHQQRRPGVDPYLRQLAQPHRVSLLGFVEFVVNNSDYPD